MQKIDVLVTTCILFVSSHALNATAAQNNIVVGANVYDEGVLSPADQNAEIERIAVRRRYGPVFPINLSTSSCKRTGTVSARLVSSIRRTVQMRKPRKDGRTLPLSEADPLGFAAWLKQRLDRLEAAGVRLTAFELGNEINTSGYNGDIPDPGTGRVLGLSDLNNPADPEAPAIVAGFRNYLRVIASLKEVRDHSKVNHSTPIILAGMAGCSACRPRSVRSTPESP